MDYYADYSEEEEDEEEIKYDNLELDFDWLEDNFNKMKTYCLYNGLDLLTSKNSFDNYIRLSTI